MTYRWQPINTALPSALSYKDGIGSCSHNGKMYAMGGWSLDNTRYNSVSFSTDGITWTQSVQPASWTPRHEMPVVSHNGRIYVIGGDQNGPGYQNDVHSWSGDEADPWVPHGSFPFLNRVGHVAFSQGGYIWAGLGQTITPFTSAPTQFFNDLWRSADGVTWELYQDDAPVGFRGYISDVAQLNGETFLIGGGTYSTTDYPARVYKNDVFAMKSDFSFRQPSIGRGSDLTPMMYHNTVGWDGKLRSFGGWANADLQQCWSSPDGKVWTQGTPPWAARHAALAIVHNDSVYYGTGAYAQDMWRLYKIDPAKWHVNLAWPGSGLTGMSATYTVIDEALTLTPGKTVTDISIDLANPRSVRPKVFRKTGATTFDCVFPGAYVSHPGGGMADFTLGNLLIPNDGYDYKVGFTFGLGGQQDRYCYTLPSGRFMSAGDIVGNGVSFSYYSDGNFSMGWIEA